MIEDILKYKYGEFLDGLDIYENKTSLILSRIIIKNDVRGEGIGSKIMSDLVNYADKNKQIVALTPSSDFGGNKNKLIQFYKRFGFKQNKGQYKNFEFRDSMIRYPRGITENTMKVTLVKNNWDSKNTVKTNIKRLFREHVELEVTDETPDVLIYNIIYNTREIGSLGLSKSNDMDNAMEIVFVQLRPDYNDEAMLVMKEVILAIWETFSEIKFILLTPQPKSRNFWHHMGANRLNDSYLMISKGH